MNKQSLLLRNKKILILVGGSPSKLDNFAAQAENLEFDEIEIKLASFSDIEFGSIDGAYSLQIDGNDLSSFDVIYFRMLGKRLEDASLVANYAKKKGIKIIDLLYTKSLLMPASLSKVVELEILISAGLPVPEIYFANLESINKNSAKILGFPFVIKSTSGKKGRDVWSAQSMKELTVLIDVLKEREKKGERFFAQRFIRASQRIRALVVGKEVIGAITRPAKWRRRLANKTEGHKEAIKLSSELETLALEAAKAVSLDICGVDILVDDMSNKPYIIEANAAPSWKAIAKDCGVNVERKILEFLSRI